MRKESEQVLAAADATSIEFDIYANSARIRLEGTLAGDWVVQSSRRNADPRVWSNEFEPGDALTADIPIAQIPGCETLVFRITGGTAGVTGWVDDTISTTIPQ